MHHIAMGGMHGCTPNHCEVFWTIPEAVEYLVEMYELGRERKATLLRAHHLELHLHGQVSPPLPADGAEYCSITHCCCTDPSVHSDSGEGPV